MSSNTSPTVLPRYTDLESESAPLLTSAGIDVNGDFKGVSGEYEGFAVPAPQRRCARFGWCKRWSQEPECKNRRCSRRKMFTRVFFFIIGAFFVFHLVKVAYTLVTLHKHVKCDEITDSTTTIESPFSRKILLHHSLSAGGLSVIHDEAVAQGSFKVQVEFDSIEDSPSSVICHGKLHRALVFGAFTRDKSDSLPSVKQTTIVLPVSAPTPFIGFGLGGHRHCADKMIRKFLNIKTAHVDAD